MMAVKPLSDLQSSLQSRTLTLFSPSSLASLRNTLLKVKVEYSAAKNVADASLTANTSVK